MSKRRHTGAGQFRRGGRDGSFKRDPSFTIQSLNAPLYLDAALGIGVADGADITTWTNQGTDPTLTMSQSTASLRPSFDEENPTGNNEPCVHFDGTEVIHTGVTAGWEAPDGNDFSYIIVASLPSAVQSPVLFSDIQASGGVIFYMRSGGASNQIVYDDLGVSLTKAGPSLSINQLYLLANSYQDSYSAVNRDHLEMWLDGVHQTADPVDAQLADIGPGASGTQELGLGSFRVASGNGIVDIYLVIGLDRLLTHEEDANLRALLNDRFSEAFMAVMRPAALQTEGGGFFTTEDDLTLILE